MIIMDCTFDRPDKPIPPHEHWQCLYAMKLQILQEKVGLTFFEAKLYLIHMEWGSLENLIELKLGIPRDTEEFINKLCEFDLHCERVENLVGDKPQRIFGRFQDGRHSTMSWGEIDVLCPDAPYHPGYFDECNGIRVDYGGSGKKCRIWYYGDPLTPQEFRQVRYAKRLWFLQEAKFSYADARLYLHAERPETLEDLSEVLHEDVDVLKGRFEEISAKVNALMMEKDIFHGHVPITWDGVR